MNNSNHGGKREGSGRPKGSIKENKKKYKTFSISCLESDYEIIKAAAEKQNKTISRFLLDFVLNQN